MDVHKWKSIARDIKMDLATGKKDIKPNLARLIGAINKRSYFLTLYSDNTEGKTPDRFFVDLSIVPNESGWDALTRLVQCIYAYRSDGHDIFLSFDSIAGSQPDLSFYLIGDSNEADDFANWLDEWFDNYAQIAAIWEIRQYKRDLRDEEAEKKEIETIPQDQHESLEDTPISQRTTQEDPFVSQQPIKNKRQSNNITNRENNNPQKYNEKLFFKVNIGENPDNKYHLTTGDSWTLCNKIIPASTKRSTVDEGDICQVCIRNAHKKYNEKLFFKVNIGENHNNKHHLTTGNGKTLCNNQWC